METKEKKTEKKRKNKEKNCVNFRHSFFLILFNLKIHTNTSERVYIYFFVEEIINLFFMKCRKNLKIEMKI